MKEKANSNIYKKVNQGGMGVKHGDCQASGAGLMETCP